MNMASGMHSMTRRAIGMRYAAAFCVFSNVFFLLTKHCEFTDGAQGLFVFGDSYTDTGENKEYPYGMTWTEDGTAHCSSDGRNLVDYIAAKFGAASPTPWEYLDRQGNPNNGGANFGVGGAAVTNAYGVRSLEQQVDVFEALMKGGTWAANHLAQSVALVAIGANDYTWYNHVGTGIKGIGAFVDMVVGKMEASLQRLPRLGVANILVDNLVPMSCMPFTTLYVNGEMGCAPDDLLDTETSLHDEKMQAKVVELSNGGANIVMLDLNKALRNVYENGPTYGFSEPYKRCWQDVPAQVCADPSKYVIFDSIHPTDAAWKVVTNLFTYSQGYTKGPTLASHQKSWA